jgi:hypothetical protein
MSGMIRIAIAALAAALSLSACSSKPHAGAPPEDVPRLERGMSYSALREALGYGPSPRADDGLGRLGLPPPRHLFTVQVDEGQSQGVTIVPGSGVYYALFIDGRLDRVVPRTTRWYEAGTYMGRPVYKADPERPRELAESVPQAPAMSISQLNERVWSAAEAEPEPSPHPEPLFFLSAFPKGDPAEKYRPINVFASRYDAATVRLGDSESSVGARLGPARSIEPSAGGRATRLYGEPPCVAVEFQDGRVTGVFTDWIEVWGKRKASVKSGAAIAGVVPNNKAAPLARCHCSARLGARVAAGGWSSTRFNLAASRQMSGMRRGRLLQCRGPGI